MNRMKKVQRINRNQKTKTKQILDLKNNTVTELKKNSIKSFNNRLD